MIKKIRGKLLLIGGLVLAWWFLRRPEQDTTNHFQAVEIPITPEPKPEPEPLDIPKKSAPKRKPKAIQKDDLTQISGIGPKISTILEAAGITSFSQLAKTSPEALWEILNQAGIRLAKPEIWIEQARQRK
jgi:predicted flap endonuclease-1-like 5' DNA nuclease